MKEKVQRHGIKRENREKDVEAGTHSGDGEGSRAPACREERRQWLVCGNWRCHLPPIDGQEVRSQPLSCPLAS